jgi:DNA repair protein RecO (recombination protein O)
VLRARNLGEADKIFTLFTRAHGKVSAVGKGVRRPKSALGGRLELLAEVTVTLHRGRNLDVIAQAQTLRSYWAQLVEPDALSAASLVAELVDMFCEPELALDDVYALLIGAVKAIAAAPQPGSVIPRFQLRLLDALGLAPSSDVCIRCGTTLPLDGGAWVDIDAGGLGCERCYGARGDAHALDAAEVENFRSLGAPRSLARATLAAAPKVARAVDDLVTFHLGRRPRARAVLDAFTP